jgi:hypothetical protein
MGKIVTVTGPQLALKALALNLAFAKAGLRETDGPNRSPQIDAVEQEFGLIGAAYCVMGQGHVYAKALAFLTGQDTAPATLRHILQHDLTAFVVFDPSCSQMKARNASRKLWRDGILGVQPGDLVFFNWKGGSAPQHVGMFEQMLGGERFATVEWNTGPGPAGNQSDGDGVYHRTDRTLRHVVGYMHLNDPALRHTFGEPPLPKAA